MALGSSDSVVLKKFRAQFDRMKDRTLAWIVIVWPAYGWPVEDVRRAAEVWRSRASTREQRRNTLWLSYDLAMNAGRPQEALALTTEWADITDNPRDYLHTRIVDGIYWDGDSSAARDAAKQLVRWADAPLAPAGKLRDQHYADICVLEQWRLHQGDVRTTAQAIARLRSVHQPATEKEFVAFRCALMLEAWSATLRKSPEAPHRTAQLDSLLKTGPPGWFDTQHANLLASRLYEMQGNRPGALAAIRRRNIFANGPTAYLSAYLREEGRLSALIGDRIRAARAYQHYLALRADPEPSLKPQVEEVRAELAKISGESAGNGRAP